MKYIRQYISSFVFILLHISLQQALSANVIGQYCDFNSDCQSGCCYKQQCLDYNSCKVLSQVEIFENYNYCKLDSDCSSGNCCFDQKCVPESTCLQLIYIPLFLSVAVALGASAGAIIGLNKYIKAQNVKIRKEIKRQKRRENRKKKKKKEQEELLKKKNGEEPEAGVQIAKQVAKPSAEEKRKIKEERDKRKADQLLDQFLAAPFDQDQQNKHIDTQIEPLVDQKTQQQINKLQQQQQVQGNPQLQMLQQQLLATLNQQQQLNQYQQQAQQQQLLTPQLQQQIQQNQQVLQQQKQQIQQQLLQQQQLVAQQQKNQSPAPQLQNQPHQQPISIRAANQLQLPDPVIAPKPITLVALQPTLSVNKSNVPVFDFKDVPLPLTASKSGPSAQNQPSTLQQLNALNRNQPKLQGNAPIMMNPIQQNLQSINQQQQQQLQSPNSLLPSLGKTQIKRSILGGLKLPGMLAKDRIANKANFNEGQLPYEIIKE